MLDKPNPHGKPNSDVIRPWVNGLDITRRNRGMWIIDFPPDTSERDAAPPFPMAPGAGRADCAHGERLEGVCLACGACDHDIVLNGACLACGSIDLDPVARSPRPELISADRLRRR